MSESIRKLALAPSVTEAVFAETIRTGVSLSVIVAVALRASWEEGSCAPTGSESVIVSVSSLSSSRSSIIETLIALRSCGPAEFSKKVNVPLASGAGEVTS